MTIKLSKEICLSLLKTIHHYQDVNVLSFDKSSKEYLTVSSVLQTALDTQNFNVTLVTSELESFRQILEETIDNDDSIDNDHINLLIDDDDFAIANELLNDIQIFMK